jgi:hypothetical protein
VIHKTSGGFLISSKEVYRTSGVFLISSEGIYKTSKGLLISCKGIYKTREVSDIRAKGILNSHGGFLNIAGGTHITRTGYAHPDIQFCSKT